MTLKSSKKLSLYVNTTIFLLVLGLMGIFAYYKVTYLVYFSIPTICVYLVNYFLIHFDRLDIFIRLTYSWITLYMAITTLCLGYNFGFHLYSLSMIPIIFYTEYMSYKVHGKDAHPFFISIIITLVYLISAEYAIENGAIYELESYVSHIFLFINAATVFGFIVFYTNLLIKIIIDSEEKLLKMAHCDRLTGLYNRHYITEQLDAMSAPQNRWIAMLDIDFFKKVNDKYGHAAGDYVLIKISEIMNNLCGDCYICRWGGEEFLLISKNDKVDGSLVENLRKEIENTTFEYEKKIIPVTISAGVAMYESGKSVDEWIKLADERLYTGKNNGRNQVVYS